MTTKEIKNGIENLNEVTTTDATTTKSCKKGGKKETANEEPKRTKSDILGELRSLFELDAVMYSEKLQNLCAEFISGKISAIDFDRLRADAKKSCIPEDVTTFAEFKNRKGVASYLQEIKNLYGVSEFSEIEKICILDEKVKIYSKDQNEDKTLISENNLFFRYGEFNASNIISAIAGAGVFLNAVRVEANKKANDRKQSLRAIEELLKRGVIDATKAEELQNLIG